MFPDHIRSELWRNELWYSYKAWNEWDGDTEFGHYEKIIDGVEFRAQWVIGRDGNKRKTRVLNEVADMMEKYHSGEPIPYGTPWGFTTAEYPGIVKLPNAGPYKDIVLS